MRVMNEWEMKYRALLSGITNQDHILAAEAMVRTAIDLAVSSGNSLDNVLHWILTITGLLETRDMPRRFTVAIADQEDGSEGKRGDRLPKRYRSKKLRRGD